MSQDTGRAHPSDRATRPTDQAPAGLGDTASVPCAFTPGPWHIEDCPCGHASCKTKQLSNVGTFYSGSGFEEADARLIAAAPELYEELAQQADGAATIISLLRGQGGPVAASLVGMLNFQEQSARAALAKARGQ